MTATTLDPIDILNKLQRQLHGIFEYMDWAEDEIEKACKQADLHARPLLFGSFLTLRPLMDMPQMLYRLHCRELLKRIAAGDDYTAPTLGEVGTLIYEMSLVTPLQTRAAAVYLRIVRQVLTPAQLRRYGLEVHVNVDTKEDYPGQFDEVETEIRRTLSNRLPERSAPYRKIPSGQRLESLEAKGIIFPKGGDMHQLYTIGYSGLALEDVARFVEERDALLIDTRLKPYSPRPEWQKAAIGRRLGTRYMSVPKLGNVNYKIGGPIQLQDEDGGISVIMNALDERPVILLCACKEPDGCHRKYISDVVSAKTGVPAIHLSIADVKPAPAPQISAPPADVEAKTQTPLEGFDVPTKTPPSVQLTLF